MLDLTESAPDVPIGPGGAFRDKINIGLPFYGRSFATATGLDQPHTGADQTHWSIDDGPQLSSMTSVWDEKTFTQYAYFADGGLVSFDNENAICAKVQYVQEHELAGLIIWELSGDVMEDLSTPLLDIMNASQSKRKGRLFNLEE
jgi:chitinase